MATAAYQAWVAKGKPYRLAEPVRFLRKWAEAHSIGVLGTIGNLDHLVSDRPLDHTPFASTQWPVKLDDPIVCAIDLENVRRDGETLGEAIERQARAGRLPWLKYMNHDHQHLDSRDLDGDGKVWEEYPSSDGHVHLSIRTDWVDAYITNFDPWEREDSMPDVNDIWGDGVIPVTANVAALLSRAKEGDKVSAGILLQNTLVIAGRAKVNGDEALAQARQNGETLTALKAAVERLTTAIGSLAPEPEATEQGKVTPATLVKKTTASAKRQ